jgi:indole-3-glycerol phosphate synthase
MTDTVPDILARIVAAKRAELARSSLVREELEARAGKHRDGHRDFRAALTSHSPAIIGEIKCASPSKGRLVSSFDPASIAKSYQRGGAAALSVLTDREFFQGDLSHLEAARAAVRIPVLRKDFTIDEQHVYQAAAHGADAILLIAAILSVAEMRRFRELATGLGLAALVEVHNGGELDAAIDSGAEIIGVNNRNLHTFEITLATSLELGARIPAGVVKVSESGIGSREDVRRLMEAGFDAFLVGEHLMRAADPAAALEALLA